MTRDEFKTELVPYIAELWPRWTITGAQLDSVWGRVQKYPLSFIKRLCLDSFEDDTRKFRNDPNLPGIYQRIIDERYTLRYDQTPKGATQ